MLTSVDLHYVQEKISNRGYAAFVFYTCSDSRNLEEIIFQIVMIVRRKVR